MNKTKLKEVISILIVAILIMSFAIGLGLYLRYQWQTCMSLIGDRLYCIQHTFGGG
jgi:hypothetical protein